MFRVISSTEVWDGYGWYLLKTYPQLVDDIRAEYRRVLVELEKERDSVGGPGWSAEKWL